MPRGGARIGSGRKPQLRVVRVGREREEADSGEAGVPILAPEDVPTNQRSFWQDYAPLATERRTLTRHTVPAFRKLCELEAELAGMRQTIERDGRTYLRVTVDGSGQEHEELRAHPLTGHYARLAKQVEGLLARFMLAPFGKPAGVAVKTAAEAKRAKVRAQFFGGAGA